MQCLKVVFVAAVLAGSTGCARRATYGLDELRRDPGLAELRLVQHADPARALESAWARGEKRFLGVRGFALAVPGVNTDVHEDLIYNRIGVRAIEGTGDFVSEEVHDLMQGASRYAARYNQLLLKRHLSSVATKPSAVEDNSKLAR